MDPFTTVAPPQPTTNLEQARIDLQKAGYCVLVDALSLPQVTALRRRLDDQALAEAEAGMGYFDGAPQLNWGSFRDESGTLRREAFTRASGGVNQRLWMLVNKGQVFIDLLSHAESRDLVTEVLGEHYILSSFTANIANPGGVAMLLHTDQWWAPPPTNRDRRNLPVGSITRKRFDKADALHGAIAPAACCNIVWMLDDFTTDNGATKVVPGSHLTGRQPDPERDTAVAVVAACAPAGSALILDGRLWHGTGANRSPVPRRGVLTTYCGPQYRPQENFTIGTRHEVLHNATPDLLALLGFQVWGGYGRCGSPLADYVFPVQEPVGEMQPADTSTNRGNA